MAVDPLAAALTCYPPPSGPVTMCATIGHAPARPCRTADSECLAICPAAYLCRCGFRVCIPQQLKDANDVTRSHHDNRQNTRGRVIQLRLTPNPGWLDRDRLTGCSIQPWLSLRSALRNTKTSRGGRSPRKSTPRPPRTELSDQSTSDNTRLSRGRFSFRDTNRSSSRRLLLIAMRPMKRPLNAQAIVPENSAAKTRRPLSVPLVSRPLACRKPHP